MNAGVSEVDAALAARYAPQLVLDRAEPYLPVAFGCTVFRVEPYGARHMIDAGAGMASLREGRPMVYVEAGKHAHWAAAAHMQPADRHKLAMLCWPLAGTDGVEPLLRYRHPTDALN